MKTVELTDATASLAEYAREIGDDTVVITDGGRPLAALVSFDEDDLESAALSENPRFMEIIERSRASLLRDGGMTLAEVRKKLNLS